MSEGLEASEMVKRVALAIREKGAVCEYCPLDRMPDDCCYGDAYAAIKSVRDSVDAMIANGVVPPLPYSQKEMSATFNALIDLALKSTARSEPALRTVQKTDC